MGIAVLFLVLGALWLLQLGLAYLQARRFMARVRRLRRAGTVAIGVAGTRLRGRAYVALAAGPDGLVTGALALRGATVLADARPVPALLGRSTAELAAGDPAVPGNDLPVPARVLEAAHEAALHFHPQLRRPIQSAGASKRQRQRGKEAGT
jgi:DNA-binding transcriptional regulator of glucitol operon